VGLNSWVQTAENHVEIAVFIGGNGWKCGNLKIGEFENCVLRTMPDFGRCSRGFRENMGKCCRNSCFLMFFFFSGQISLKSAQS
jgi:hypothetical protein